MPLVFFSQQPTAVARFATGSVQPQRSTIQTCSKQPLVSSAQPIVPNFYPYNRNNRPTPPPHPPAFEPPGVPQRLLPLLQRREQQGACQVRRCQLHLLCNGPSGAHQQAALSLRRDGRREGIVKVAGCTVPVSLGSTQLVR